MNLFDLQKLIKSNSIPKFMIFTGEEYAIINLYIEQIRKRLNLTEYHINKVEQVVKKHAVINLLCDNRLYICRYDADFAKNESLWNGIDTRLGSNYLILILSSIDGRSKLLKQFNERIFEFKEQDDNTINIMLQGKTKLSKEHINRLILGCKHNYSKILLELEKIRTLSAVRNIDEDTAYELLISEGSIYESQESKLQEFMEAIMQRNAECFSIYKSLLNSGESNLIMIAWLYNTIRNQLCVQTTKNPSCDNTGLSYFFLKECFARMNKYTNAELLNALRIIKFCEQGIKNGNIEEQNSVNYIMVHLL